MAIEVHNYQHENFHIKNVMIEKVYTSRKVLNY